MCISSSIKACSNDAFVGMLGRVSIFTLSLLGGCYDQLICRLIQVTLNVTSARMAPISHVSCLHIPCENGRSHDLSMARIQYIYRVDHRSKVCLFHTFGQSSLLFKPL